MFIVSNYSAAAGLQIDFKMSVFCKRLRGCVTIKEMATATLSEFRNEAYADFSQPANRQAMEQALQKVRSEFGREYQLRISGDSIATGDRLVSVNPSNPQQVVGIHHKATPELANRAVESAYAAFAKWSRPTAVPSESGW